ncbi:hypothetical protein OZN62_11395 [Aurantiacibacter sp. MUD11]|uniref:hypothetical protein n=1 Tax=Aurantiacibacter sp. MUD11 TaxID=3003265 RepID=UPI0022AB1055|nr:hypothetical protein [Aurantiacibacter sp. MUD11]WAT17517.1 hypothetical protein OZN62_11395 [Aurantiacibacter sp. MUD11]
MTKRLCAALLASAAFATPATAEHHAAPDCDRDCLIALADAYASGVVADDPGAVRWTDNAVVVENLAAIAPGEGIFDSVTAGPASEFVIHVADPVSQQVGLLALMSEGEEDVLVGIRLQLGEDGAVAEAEHLVARDLSPPQLANLQTPRPRLMEPVPAAYMDSRARMIWLGESYYDSLDNNNSLHSNMADDCERRENGFQTARNPMVRESNFGNGQFDPVFAYLGGLGCAAQMDTNMWEYITRIENRRVEIADPVTGLVWGVSHFEHDFDKQDFALIGVPWADNRHMEYDPFDMPAIHIYKVWGGAIHEIEALGIVMPYQSDRFFEEE